jgi:hypothetical protein
VHFVAPVVVPAADDAERHTVAMERILVGRELGHLLQQQRDVAVPR